MPEKEFKFALDGEDHRRLKKYSLFFGISMGKLVRRAIKVYFSQTSSEEAIKREREHFRILRKR